MIPIPYLYYPGYITQKHCFAYALKHGFDLRLSRGLFEVISAKGKLYTIHDPRRGNKLIPNRIFEEAKSKPEETLYWEGFSITYRKEPIRKGKKLCGK